MNFPTKSQRFGRRAINLDPEVAERIAERLKALGQKYASEFPSKAAEIRSLWDKIDDGEPETLESLYRAVHSLSGSGETFGFPKLSEAAKQCEAVLLAGMKSGRRNIKTNAHLHRGGAAARERLSPRRERLAP